jgi:excisionase family DNA binding protein
VRQKPEEIRRRLLTASEAAEYLGLAETTVRQWASMRKIPAVKLGRSLRFDVLELEKWLGARKQPALDR